MITFYPSNIEMWQAHFDFNPSITLTPKEKTDHKVFNSRTALMMFLKEHGVKLNDPASPLRFDTAEPDAEQKGNPAQGELLVVVQNGVLGWIRDDYRG